MGALDRYDDAAAMSAALAEAMVALPPDPEVPPLVAPERIARARAEANTGPTLVVAVGIGAWLWWPAPEKPALPPLVPAVPVKGFPGARSSRPAVRRESGG